MLTKITDKFFSALVIFFLAFTAPWWLTFIVATILLFATASYWTAIFAALTMDILHGPQPTFIGSLKFTLMMIALSSFILFVRKRLIFY